MNFHRRVVLYVLRMEGVDVTDDPGLANSRRRHEDMEYIE